MTEKIIKLALAAASVAAFALPAAAMAEDVPVHVVPKPEGAKKIDGEGSTTVTASFGSISSTGSSGTATFTSSTTGKIELTFTGFSNGFGPCTSEGQASGTVTTTELEFHLLTVEDSVTHATGPGMLITTTNGHFATFTCPFTGTTVVGGNGLIGTIKSPECGKESTEATIEFSSSSQGVQTHKTVVGTTTEYSLTAGGGSLSLDAKGIITLGTKSKLECT